MRLTSWLTAHTGKTAAHAASPTAKHLADHVVEATAHAAHSTSSTTASTEHVPHLLLLVVFSTGFGGADAVVGRLYFLEFGF